MRAPQPKPESKPARERKWWLRVADGDWRWADYSYQQPTELKPKEEGQS